MAKGVKTGGRTKGTPNKTTASAREAFGLAFEGVGGVPSLISWARENQTEFFKLYARMIPQEVSGPDGDAIPVEAVVRFVKS